MTDEIHMFMAVATALDAAPHPAGEAHPLLIMIRQSPQSDHDWDAAEAVARRAGWTDIDFTKAGTLPADAADQRQEPFHSCYLDALNQGHSLLIYETVVRAAPPKNSGPVDARGAPVRKPA